MAVDHWYRTATRKQSDRLVAKNGIFSWAWRCCSGAAARSSYWWCFYSISVFLTFFRSLLGLSIIAGGVTAMNSGWLWRLGLTLWGLAASRRVFWWCCSWLKVRRWRLDRHRRDCRALVGLCLLVYGHYRKVRLQLMELDEILGNLPAPEKIQTPLIREGEPAAVFFVSSYRGIGIHTLLNAQRLFPDGSRTSCS